MKKLLAKPWMKYVVTVAINLAVAACYFFNTIPAEQIALVERADLAMILCDAFFLPGVFTLMIGLLLWVASEGALDGVGYLGSCLIKTLIPGKHGTFERYGDYLERKRENRKKGGEGFLVIIGCVFVLIALLFLALFYRFY